MEKLPYRGSGLPVFVVSVVAGVSLLAVAAWLHRVDCTFCGGSGRWVIREPEVIKFDGCAMRCPQHPPSEWKIPGESAACGVCRANGKISLLQKTWFRRRIVTTEFAVEPVVPGEN